MYSLLYMSVCHITLTSNFLEVYSLFVIYNLWIFFISNYRFNLILFSLYEYIWTIIKYIIMMSQYISYL